MQSPRLLRATLRPAIALAAILVSFFLFGDWLEITATEFLIDAGDVAITLATIALLAADVFLPVPTSVVSLAAAGALGLEWERLRSGQA